ncbi:MAG: hypothetical protein QT10_C0016G0013 [archaeon GW2011_AR19]|nr:MAG: hypothetical protein QT10_C0016G0013 [archaeon GW2011_AR19]
MENDDNLLSELLLIIGGFILAETIIRWFLSFSEGVLSIWILPALSILLIITALDIKKHGTLSSKMGITSTLFLTISIVFIVLMKVEKISPISFLRIIFWMSIITIIIQGIFFFSRFKK